MNKLPPLPPATERCWVGPITSGHWEWLIRESAAREYGQQCSDIALDALMSVNQEVETTLVIGDEIGMRDGLTQILKELDASLGITT